MTINSFRYLAIPALLALCLCLLAATAAYGDGEPDPGVIAVRIADEQVRLDDVRSQMAVLDLQIAAQEQYVEQSREQLAEARMLLQDAEDRYNATLRLYEQRITSMYKMGEGQFYGVLLSSDSISDAATRLSYLSQISENDMKLVERVRFEEAQVRSLHSRIDEIKQGTAGELEQLKLERLELEGQAGASEQVINEQMADMAEAEAREMEKLAASVTSEPGVSIYDNLMSPSVLIGNVQPPDDIEPSGIVFTGVASWYGPGFHGNNTANGEVYDMFAYTAAHKTLPFGTWLKVTYNGRSVFVRVNDRGPYIGGRFLDLSAAASRAIGMTGVGLVTAEIYR